MKKVFTPKICKVCGAEYVPHNSNQCYCGAACQKVGHNERQRYYDNNVRKRLIMTLDDKIDRKIEVGMSRRERHRDPNVSLNEVARRAAEAHMTYGKYVLMHKI